jgi:hypothetical protein
MGESTDTEHNSSAGRLDAIKLQTAKAELEKLNLEIAELKRGRGLEGRIVRFIPIITALISIAGFITGLLIFVSQQTQDRRARAEERKSRELNDYRTGYEQILLFSSNDKMTIARVLALKQDLDALKDSLYSDKEKVEQKERLQESICVLISKDFDFGQPRLVAFDIAALQKWKEYQDGLKQTLNPDGTGETVNESIIDKYLQVIRELEMKEPGTLKNTDVSTGSTDPQIILKEPQRSAVNGFACHVNLLQTEQKNQKIDLLDAITEAHSLAAILKSNFQCPPLPATPARPEALAKPAN